MSVYEGGYSERTQPFQTPVWSDSLCAILLRSGWSWDVFWKGGRAAATHQHRRFWAWHEWQVKDPFSCEQIAQECAQVCRAALRLLKATFWTSWTCLVLFVNTQQLRIKRALDLLIWFSILFSLSLSFFFPKFFGGAGGFLGSVFLLSRVNKTNFYHGTGYGACEQVELQSSGWLDER